MTWLMISMRPPSSRRPDSTMNLPRAKSCAGSIPSWLGWSARIGRAALPRKTFAR